MIYIYYMKHLIRYSISILTTLILLSSIPAAPPKKVVFFGDSITQAGVEPGGYITKMRQALKGDSSKYSLIGAGIGGNKVYDLYLRMEDDVLAKKPDVVVIWVGVNDVWHKTSHGTGTDADKFEKFYTAIISKLQQKGIKVILCTPGAIGEKKNFVNRNDGDLNAYSEIIRNLAAKYNCPVSDFRKTFVEYDLQNNPSNADSGILTSDGVHLNDAGNDLAANMLLKIITGLK
jgi:lysophospholipase L1-like esterase